MSKIKISHETPLCLLKESLNFNNYQYCLPHLMDESEEYKQHFLDCRDKGIEIYMDNSLHELGTPYSEDRLFYWLQKLQPQEFFIPDYWEDKIKSIKSAKKWIEIQKQFPNITFTAVVQGKNYGEIKDCYKNYKELGYKKIAFSYGASYYNEICPHPNKNLGKALGRVQVINKLIEMDLITKTDKIHLLGCAVPQEFGWYKDIPQIESIDTSNPVMATLHNLSYDCFGLSIKPKSCMNDNFHINKDDINMTLLEHNIRMFKEINGL